MKSFAHSRNNYHWQHAVHESLYFLGEGNEHILNMPELVTEHHQLPKDRSNYMALLEQECRGATCTKRHIFWLIREYTSHKKWEQVIEWTDKYVKYPDLWHVEHATALKCKAKALSELGKSEEALVVHMESIARSPGTREIWMDLAWYHYTRKQWLPAYAAICQALTLVNKPTHYLTTEESWGYKIHETAYFCALRLQLKPQAAKHIDMAIRLAPNRSDLVKLKDALNR